MAIPGKKKPVSKVKTPPQPPHMRYPEMKVPKKFGQTYRQVRMRSSSGYETDIDDRVVDSHLRLGWEIVDDVQQERTQSQTSDEETVREEKGNERVLRKGKQTRKRQVTHHKSK